MSSRRALPILLLLPSCGGQGGTVCTSDQLKSALASASNGGKVQLGACTIMGGGFEVPAGTSLSGTGLASRIVSASGGPALHIATKRGATTTIASMTIESGGRAAIIATGQGAFALEHARIHAVAGIGVGFEGLARAELDDVMIDGPVTKANAALLPMTVSSTVAATHGLVGVGTASVTITHVQITGFAEYGALFTNATTSWRTGSIQQNLGIGLFVEGGQMSISGVEIAESLQGFRLLPAFGAAFASGASVISERLSVHDNEGYGLFHDSASVKHADLSASGNANAAVWAQSSSDVEISGSIMDNSFAGVVVAESQNVHIHDAQILRTKRAIRVFGSLGMVEIGDGVQLSHAASAARLTNLSLDDNQRTGVLIDLDGQSTSGVTLMQVQVTVTSTTEGGVVAQGGTIEMGWDDGVIRNGTNAARDSALAGRFRPVRAVGPCDRPRESGLMQGGLQTLIGM